MKTKVVTLILCMLMCVTACAAAETQLADKNPRPIPQLHPTPHNNDMWNVEFQFDAGGESGSLYLVGIGFDGTYFYLPEWASATIHKFDITGAYLGSFTIPGVPNLIDLTYDGTYFYGQGQSPTNVIYILDMANATLVGTIPTPSVAWNIAYDADHDGFWVGQWSNSLVLIDRQGNILDSMTPPDSMLGMAWDPYTQIDGYDGPFLWISTGTSSGQDNIIKVIDLATKTLVPGVEHDVATELGAGMAGGLDLTTDYDSGVAVLYGTTQGTTNDYAFGYELTTVSDTKPPVTTISLAGEMEGNVYVSDVTATLNATDKGSGVNHTYYKIDSGDWNTYSAPFVVSGNGLHTIYFYSTDLAGNTEVTKNATCTINYPFTVKITGGLGVTVSVTNNGTAPIDLGGAIIISGPAFPKSKSIIVTGVGAGETKAIHDFIIGFGKITIQASINGKSWNAEGKALLFFVTGVK